MMTVGRIDEEVRRGGNHAELDLRSGFRNRKKLILIFRNVLGGDQHFGRPIHNHASRVKQVLGVETLRSLLAS